MLPQTYIPQFRSARSPLIPLMRTYTVPGNTMYTQNCTQSYSKHTEFFEVPVGTHVVDACSIDVSHKLSHRTTQTTEHRELSKLVASGWLCTPLITTPIHYKCCVHQCCACLGHSGVIACKGLGRVLRLRGHRVAGNSRSLHVPKLDLYRCSSSIAYLYAREPPAFVKRSDHMQALGLAPEPVHAQPCTAHSMHGYLRCTTVTLLYTAVASSIYNGLCVSCLQLQAVIGAHVPRLHA
jgi:hypothetical protein